MFYDVHLLAADDWDDPQAALARQAARALRARAVDPAMGLPTGRSRRPRGPLRVDPSAAPAPDPSERAAQVSPSEPDPRPSAAERPAPERPAPECPAPGRPAPERRAAERLAPERPAPDPLAPLAPVPVAAEVVERVRARWVRPGEGLRVEVGADTLLVRLPYWYAGKQARVQAKVLHGLVADLEKASGRRGFDPQLDDWLGRRDARDTAAVLDAVADFDAREHVDSPAVDARRAARSQANRGRRLWPGRGRT